MKNRILKKIGIQALIMIVVFAYFFIKSDLSYRYVDNSEYHNIYDVKIKKIIKILYIDKSQDCNFAGCNKEVQKCSLKISYDEYSKIMNLWDDKAQLSPLLEMLCKDQKECDKAIKEEDISNISTIDNNSDGKITCREYANYKLENYKRKSIYHSGQNR